MCSAKTLYVCRASGHTLNFMFFFCASEDAIGLRTGVNVV